jgi:hypothetical protein
MLNFSLAFGFAISISIAAAYGVRWGKILC